MQLPTPCPVCRMAYVDDDSNDVRYHKHYHHKYLKATDDCSYEPMSYNEREHLKRNGHQMIRNGATIEDQLAGAEQVLDAWFDRSFTDAISDGSYRTHVSREVYILSILSEVDDGVFSSEMKNALRMKYSN